ncbi:hypothetical protein [Cyclobacterium amurskyense]|uniref:hypothetical protein n=1 Tax=Cyclobacterium amurskyense TaxID=320787 RepID=UPI0030D8894D
MLKSLLIMVLLLLATVSPTVLAKNHAHLPIIETSSERTALVMSWRLGSEQFSVLHEQLRKDFAKWGSSQRMVKNIFYRSHKQLFQEYRQYSLTQDTFISGSYDCVSGSLILAGLLDYFGFDYEVIETTYHVFLKVALANEFIVLEVTDPETGFIADRGAQKAYLAKYSSGEGILNQWNVLTRNEGEAIPTIYRSIDLENLIGLQYFNQAISHYNNKNELLAYQYSVTALKMYRSERILDFSDFLKQNLLLSASR